jgi:anti-sigma regulatory factor (Ser/Thr protein kinase)
MTPDPITIKSNPCHLAQVRAFVRSVAAEAGFNEETTFHLMLAVDEACTNIMRHAYGGDATQDIIISARVSPEAVEFRLRDYGRQADPACMKSRDLDDVRPGGLGCFLIRQTFNEVEYNTHFPTGTELRLLKRRQ